MAGRPLRWAAVGGAWPPAPLDWPPSLFPTHPGHHEWLLGPKVDILPFLLLPLAGPEDFSEEEMERLPVDLQYLPPDKQREPDPDIRKMLIEAIMLVSRGPSALNPTPTPTRPH